MPIEKLLSQLKGIHPPTDPGWWPLAVGWWIIIALVMASIIIAVYLNRRKKMQQRYRQAKSELNRIADDYQRTKNDQLLLNNLSKWLRQVNLIAFPNRQIAAVTGQQWVEFLDRTMTGCEFTKGAGKAFAGDIYQKQVSINTTELLKVCAIWLDSVKPYLANKNKASNQILGTTC